MDEDAEDASPAREDADRGVRLLVDPRCQEALEILSAAIDHPERRVARFGQLGGRVDDALQQRVERELGAERDASVQQPPKSIHSPNLPRKSCRSYAVRSSRLTGPARKSAVSRAGFRITREPSRRAAERADVGAAAPAAVKEGARGGTRVPPPLNQYLYCRLDRAAVPHQTAGEREIGR